VWEYYINWKIVLFKQLIELWYWYIEILGRENVILRKLGTLVRFAVTRRWKGEADEKDYDFLDCTTALAIDVASESRKRLYKRQRIIRQPRGVVRNGDKLLIFKTMLSLPIPVSCLS
jgi:hypothetical protein